MFTKQALRCVSSKYFRIIDQSAYTITLQSQNTQHCWHILYQSYGKAESCLIYHTHKEYTPYHLHGHAKNIKIAIKKIKEHDMYQMQRNVHCNIY